MMAETVIGLLIFFVVLLSYAFVGGLDDEYWSPPEDEGDE